MRDRIDEYLRQLERRLAVGPSERQDILAEVRAHLEERAAAARLRGIPDDDAELRALEAFGDVGSISRQMNAAHPIRWGWRRWGAGMMIGAALTWALWLAGTVPAMLAYFQHYQVIVASSPPPSAAMTLEHIIIYSSPLSSGGFYGYLFLGWLWLLPLLALYLLPPLLWGRRARRWWAPGLAYGLGTWLSAPWFVLGLFSADWAWSAQGRLIALALPLALAASYLGGLWRSYNASAVTGELAA